MVLSVRQLGLILAVLLTAVTGANAGVVVSTGFEPPDYSLGPINGQNGWTGNGDIQNGVVQSGTQALHINARGDNFSGASLGLNLPVADQVVTIDFDMLQSHAVAQAGFAVFGDSGFIAQIAGASGSLVLGNTNSNTPPQAAAEGIWHHLQIELDFHSSVMEGFLDGQSMGTIAINTPPPLTAITGLEAYSFGPGVGEAGPRSQDIYFDNLQVVATPEPGSIVAWSMLAFGAWIVARRRKRLRG